MPPLTDEQIDAIYDQAQASQRQAGQRMSDAQIDAIYDQNQPKQPQPLPPSQQNRVPQALGIPAKLAQGITFGASDEMGAFLPAMAGYLGDRSAGGNKPFKQIFKERHAPIEAGLKQYSKESPKMAFGAEMAGALGLGVATGGTSAAATGTSAAATAPRLLPTVAKGAGASGLYGFNSASGDLKDRAKAGAVSAAIGGAGTGILGLAGKGVGLLRKSGDAAADGLERASVGVEGKSILGKMFRKGTAEIDDQGEAVFKNLDIIKKDGFFKTASNHPGKLKKQINSKIEELASAADDIFQDAIGVGKTIKKPDFGEVHKFISKKVLAPHRSSLTKMVKEVEDDLASSNSLEALLDLKRQFNPSIFKGTTSAAERNAAKIERKMYGLVKEAIEENFDDAMRASGKPEKVGAYKGINKKISAYMEIDKTVDDVVSKFGDQRNLADLGPLGFLLSAIGVGTGGAGAALALPSVAKRVIPMTTSRALRKTGGLMKPIERGLGAPGRYPQVVGAISSKIPDSSQE